MLGSYWKKNLGTHLLLVLVAAIWGSTWAAGRFLSYGLNEDAPATLSPATSAWLRYVFAVSVFFLWSISSRGEGSFRFLPRWEIVGFLYLARAFGDYGLPASVYAWNELDRSG